jgi:hypothetical protein
MTLLAYAFWHWKQPGVADAEYEDRQRAFHAALGAAPPEGFVSSSSYAITGAPWAFAGGAAYEDWYLVRDSAALDALNAGAVSASRLVPHDAAASVAAGGIAGLYRNRIGNPPHAPVIAHWFSKPSGMSYPALDALVGPTVEARGGTLWCRQMTLGPTPEFCLQLPDHAAWPSEAFNPQPIPLRRIA